MFIKTSVFKRLIKTTWTSSGLTVGRRGEHYIVKCSQFVLYINEKYFKKEIKAAIIELVGELPEQGEIFKEDKEGNRQQEMALDEIWDIGNFKECNSKYKKTEVFLNAGGDLQRVIQDESTKEKFYIPENIVEMVSTNDMEEGERFPEGPVGREDFVIWRNETSTLVTRKTAGRQDTKEADVMRALRGVNL